MIPFSYIPGARSFVNRVAKEKWSSALSLGGIIGEKPIGEIGLDCPVFIAHGADDNDIPCTHSRILFLQAIRGHIHRSSPNRSLKGLVLPKSKTITKYSNEFYEIHQISFDGFLWISRDFPEIWYVEILHCGHNNVHNFDLMIDSVSKWIQEI